MKTLQVQWRWIGRGKGRTATLIQFNKKRTEVLAMSKISVKVANMLIASGVQHGS